MIVSSRWGVHLVVKVGLQKQTRTQGLFAVFAFPGASMKGWWTDPFIDEMFHQCFIDSSINES